MKTRKSRIVLGVIAMLALALVVGGLSITTAFAQGPWQGENPPNTMHDNQAVLDLLKSTETELLELRQAGKSWVEIATAQGVTEAALLEALLKPMNERHAWMAETYPQFNAAQMTELMRTQLENDLNETEFGTIADRHVLGGGGMRGNWNNTTNNWRGTMHGRGMMGNWDNDANGFGGMMGGRGMMGNRTNSANGFGGMMRGGGMMNGWNNLPNVTPEPAQ